MATHGSPPPGWPLTNPPAAPPPPTSPPPSYSPRTSSREEFSAPVAPNMPKRKPLATAQGNGSMASPRSPLSPTFQKNFSPQESVPSLQRKNSFETGDDEFMRQPVQPAQPAPAAQAQFEQRNARRKSSGPLPAPQSIPMRPRVTPEQADNAPRAHSGVISTVNGSLPGSRNTSGGSYVNVPPPKPQAPPEPAPEPLHYHHQAFSTDHNRRQSGGSNTSRDNRRRPSLEPPPPVPSHGRLTPASAANVGRPNSAYSNTSDSVPIRHLSPGTSNTRTPSPSRHSPDNRPMSFVDLLNVPYPQPPPAPTSMDNAALRSSVGGNATLLDTKKTLEMYRANVKKTNDPTIQYEFAIFMVNAATEAANELNPSNPDSVSSGISSPTELLREARHILQRLSDRSYPFAQYYLADGYASGLFNKGIPDNDRAFPLFVAASKHGHAEAGYRAALCYEFGWGNRKDPLKAVQFYRQAASKNHPGACTRLGRACLVGDLGLVNRYKEGVKWLKRAAESADFQYNAAPYELGVLHETGYGDDIFREESYAAQLFTQSADLGHPEASYRLGDAYEHGKLSCPKDPALSVHFYTNAADKGHPSAMMALCAWYLVGAEPVLEKDENEAYEWARKAAESGLPKAQYAIAYFTEMGIGTRRDPLEANVWYVRAADQGDERAKHRIAAIRAAASGEVDPVTAAAAPSGGLGGRGGGRGGGGFGADGDGGEGGKKKKWGLF